MKRFYKEVSSGPVENGFGVQLDSKSIKTPAGQSLAVPAAALAEAVAAEWEAQGETIVPSSMPLTQMVSTALDRMPLTRGQVQGYIAGFGASDVLCYRADSPVDLVGLQSVSWQPWLDWAARELDAPLAITAGVTPVVQEEDSLAALRRRVETYDDWVLTALQSLAPCLGSLVLSLAVIEGKLAADEAFELSRLEERFQNDRWGLDHEAKKRNDGLRQEVLAAARLIELIKAG
ncbi:MAG TPA: ATP12 family protein [Magnetospirillaceae bacterium]|nr:ATP12 family protein [Magnetospirillaceae bacterium]